MPCPSTVRQASEPADTHGPAMKRRIASLHLGLAFLGALSGCASTTVESTGQALPSPLCGPTSVTTPATTSVAVLWGPSWRPDQKEPPLREAAALRGIQQFFASQRCLTDVALHRIDIPAQGELPDDALLATAKARTPRADKVILIVVRELGPKLAIGLPTLVEGGTEVVIEVRVLDARHPVSEAQVRTHWQKGGPFYIQGVRTLDQDMQAALSATLAAPAAPAATPQRP